MIDREKLKPLGSVALISRDGVSRAAEVVALGRDEALVGGVDGLLEGTLLKLQFQIPRRREQVLVEVRVAGQSGDGTLASPFLTRMRFARADEDVLRDIERFLSRDESAATDTIAATRPIALEPGAVLGGRYQITEALTSDPSFLNFEGVDRTTSTPVLLRVLKAAQAGPPLDLDRMRVLHLAGRAVQHPHVLRIFDYVSEGERQVVVTEHGRGPRLTQMLRTRGPFSLDAIGRAARQILSGLAAIRSRGLPYGCLHPGRVRISSGFNARIADLATAQLMPFACIAPDDDPIAYAAPEVRLRSEPTERGEVYSVGMLLYALAIGRTPYSSDERAALEVRPDLQPTPPGQSRLPVPPALIPIVERAISNDPNARYASLERLSADLQPLFEDAPRMRPTHHRILVVEDDPGLRHMMVAALKSVGNEVLTAENGIEALEIAFREPLDLICLDIRMPRMDGFEVCMVLRSDERSKTVPILVVSSVTTADTVTLMESLGASDFLPKPFEEDDLLERVDKLLSR